MHREWKSTAFLKRRKTVEQTVFISKLVLPYLLYNPAHRVAVHQLLVIAISNYAAPVFFTAFQVFKNSLLKVLFCPSQSLRADKGSIMYSYM
jgi:hypothetical protein